MLSLFEKGRVSSPINDDVYQHKFTIFFFHIGKTAGTTFTNLLFRQYRQDEILRIILRGNGIGVNYREYAQLPDSEKEKIRLITGHMPFGLHEFNPYHPIIFLFSLILSSGQSQSTTMSLPDQTIRHTNIIWMLIQPLMFSFPSIQQRVRVV